MLRLPVLEGVIRRRLLLNFRVAPEVIRRLLPAGLRPKLHHGHAIAGICLIRLEDIRPKHLPGFAGVTSENGAHRIAVEWDQDGHAREGVYIPRRDTSSLLNHYAGGRLFPGEHHHATFEVEDDGDRFHVLMRANGDDTLIEVRGGAADSLPVSSVFGSLAEASAFFEAGSVGYSATADGERLDGIKLVTNQWRVTPAVIDTVRSSFFDDEDRFPRGSAVFDCGLVMRNIAHEWHAEAGLPQGR